MLTQNVKKTSYQWWRHPKLTQNIKTTSCWWRRHRNIWQRCCHRTSNQRQINVISMAMRRHDATSSLLRRCLHVACLLSNRCQMNKTKHGQLLTKTRAARKPLYVKLNQRRLGIASPSTQPDNYHRPYISMLSSWIRKCAQRLVFLRCHLLIWYQTCSHTISETRRE